MRMMDREWELDWAVRAYHTIDRNASEAGGRKTEIYMVEDDANRYQGDETEDVATVLVNLAEFGINDSSGADDQISMVDMATNMTEDLAEELTENVLKQTNDIVDKEIDFVPLTEKEYKHFKKL